MPKSYAKKIDKEFLNKNLYETTNIGIIFLLGDAFSNLSIAFKKWYVCIKIKLRTYLYFNMTFFNLL